MCSDSAWEGNHCRTNTFRELKKDAMGVKSPRAETPAAATNAFSQPHVAEFFGLFGAIVEKMAL